MGLFGPDDNSAIEQLEATKRAYEAIGMPDVTWRDLAPEAYENETANYELIGEDPTLRSSQMSLLNRMSGLAETGLSDVDAAGFAKARASGQQQAKAGTDAALANAQARGVGGSGLEFAMREAANQAGAERTQAGALDQASQAAQQRALYQTAYGSQLGSQRSQDLAANSANTNIINQFNQANTAQRNSTNAANTEMRNNTQAANNAGRTAANQQQFNNQITRTGGIAEANTGLAKGYAAREAASQAQTNQLIQIGATVAGGPVAGAAAGAALNSQKKAGY